MEIKSACIMDENTTRVRYGPLDVNLNVFVKMQELACTHVKADVPITELCPATANYPSRQVNAAKSRTANSKHRSVLSLEKEHLVVRVLTA